MRSGLLIVCALSGTACAAVQSSVLVTGPAQPPAPGAGAVVTVSSTRDPAGAEELGLVEAHGRLPQARLGDLVAEFQGRVSSMGGNFARIDSFATRHELVAEQYTYDCGHDETRTETRIVTRPGTGGTTTTSTEPVDVTRHVAKTCFGTREVEAATLTLVGRAFRTR